MAVHIFLATTPRGIARAARRGDGGWLVERVLPDHDCLSLCADPRRTAVVYAGTNASGVWRSADGGSSWRAIGLAGRPVTALAASPIDSSVMYAGVRPKRLYVSRDAGASWAEVEGFRQIPWRWTWFSPASLPYSAYVQAIVPSLDDPETITVGVEFGATVRTVDGGRTWSRHLRGSLRDCHSLAAHHADPSWLYEAGGTGAGVAFSADGGVTWRQPSSGLDRHYGWACAADPAQPEVWYASLSPSPRKAHSENDAQAAIFRMGPDGWERLAGGLPQPLPHMPYSLLTDPVEPGHLYAGLANGDVWHSADHGDSWRQLPLSLGLIHRAMIGLA